MSARLTGAFTAVMAVLGTAAVVAPGLAALTWALFGVVSVATIGFAVRQHRPAPATPWWLLAGGLAAEATGDVGYALAVRGPADEAPLIVDVCYLSVYPLLALGLLRLTRPSLLFRNRSPLIDLLALASAVALPLWTFVVGPMLTSSQLAPLEASLLATYAFGDLLLVVTLAVVLLTVRRSPAVVLLTVGAAGMLTADLLYTYAEAGSGWQPGGLVELGWVLLYACWGLAALHPSMVELTTPVVALHGQITCRRRTLLMVCGLVPPTVLLVESLTGRLRDGPVIAAVSAIVFVLVFSRLDDGVQTYRNFVERERHLRQACGHLVAATDADEVDDAVRRAVAMLMPPGAGHRVAFTVGGTEPAPTCAGDRPAVPGQYVPVSRRTRLVRTFTLPPSIIEKLGGFPATLSCPLLLEQARSEPSPVGALYIAADGEVLANLHDAMEVLAAQTTLALARISVADQMQTRDGERYFRAVSHNTADVVLIVDDKDRIRYASPSLAQLVGTDAVPFSPLIDLIHPDGRDQVVHTLRRARKSHNPDGVREDWVLRWPDGTRLLVEVSCRDLRADRMVQGLVITMRDVTGRREQEQELIRRAVQESAPGRNRRSMANRFRSY